MKKIPGMKNTYKISKSGKIMIKSIIIGVLVGLLGLSIYQVTNNNEPLAAVGGFADPFISLQLAASPQNGYILSTDGTDNSWIENVAGTTYLATTTPWTTGDIVEVADGVTVKSTSTLSASKIEDAYVRNTGDTMTGQLVISGVAIDITTVDAEALTLAPAGAGALELQAGSGGVSITTTAGNSNITLNPNGSGNLIFSDLTSAVLTVDGSGVVTASTSLASSFIEDVFLFNTGDIGSGVFDFGGADSFEIVNGLNPTLDAAGEIAFNTASATLEAYSGTEILVWSATTTRTIFGLASTTEINGSSFDTATVTIQIGDNPNPTKYTRLNCFTNSGTAAAQLGDLSASTSIALSTSDSDTALTSNNTFDGNEKVYLAIGSPSATGDGVTCHWFYQETR